MTTFIRYTHYRERIIDGRWVFEYGMEEIEEIEIDETQSDRRE